MFDTRLRPLKDTIFATLTWIVPSFITPTYITFLAFLFGIGSCIYAAHRSPRLSLLFWILNRVLDCLDGAVARRRNTASDLGGFLDLLCDFIIYSFIPISCALGIRHATNSLWLSVAILESSFHVNNFVLFYVAAILEKRKSTGGKTTGLTSVAMRPALIEGTESGMIFTAMLVWPEYLEGLSCCMAVLVGVGIIQRTWWLTSVL
ncbi:hypothetical protein CC78DRAFT_170900 [Lojkania enalia]|uniref:CDP-alcohol phosphatidyltransferase n=1 Tax=Lojkania enalia TaxID=147567 RepID=A0A9P4JVT9_9PLEO|nr:hypothetical protein CC78DRAFT_170900 [Didymosphaeria enalia]